MGALHAAVDSALSSIGPGLYGVACSGGADSMALADVAIEVAGSANIVVITIDHGLSAGSDRVAAEVAAWAHGRGAAAIVRRVTVERAPSIEAAARDARYAALCAIADEVGLSAILVGHTARDQAETVLMRILRGTGPAGLAAIPKLGRACAAVPGGGVLLIRPWLSLDRELVEEHARARDLPIFDDPMNADTTLLRVRVRREILPDLRRENPQLEGALVRLATSTREWLAVIDDLARPFARFPIDCATLAAQPAAVRKRAVALALEAEGVGWDSTHLDAIDAVIAGPARGEIAIDLPSGRFVRSYDAARFETEPRSVVVTPLAVPAGCEARPWVAGDRMRPARLKGKSRKLSDLFADAKVPRSSRGAARVIVRSSDAAIVWAEHIGIAHDSVVTDEERQILSANPHRTGGSF